MKRRFDGKTAIVTGAATGIGRAAALKLGAEGASVAVNHRDTGSLSEAREVVEAIEAAGGRAFAACADVADTAQVRGLFDATLERFGRLDVVVNNAAYAALAPIAETSEETFDRIFAVNVKGAFFACQEAARRLADGGRIINLSSSTTGLALPGYGVYDASKGAVEQITRILARELGPRGITVNTVSPGATETAQFRAGKSDELIQRLSQMSVFGRLGRVEEVADVIAFLAGPEAGWVTGQNIRVNGGTV
jgi:3-oxoacyl-[acyl-carrier protein] reductase